MGLWHCYVHDSSCGGYGNLWRSCYAVNLEIKVCDGLVQMFQCLVFWHGGRVLARFVVVRLHGRIHGAFWIARFVLSCCKGILAKNWFVSWLQECERSYVNGGSKELHRSRSARGHAFWSTSLALFRRGSCGKDGVEGQSGMLEKRRERSFVHFF